MYVERVRFYGKILWKETTLEYFYTTTYKAVNMKNIFHLIAIICVLHYTSVEAQVRMEFNAALNNTPFRVAFGDTLNYNVFIINDDSSTYSGNLFAGFLGSNSGGADSVFVGTFQIPPNNTITATISILVQPQAFKTGPEVVVVWPIFDGGKGEQLADFIFVSDNLLSVENYTILNPTIKNNIISTDKTALKRVRILALTGQTIFESEPNHFSMQLPKLTPSLYLIEYTTSDNRTSVMKHFPAP